MTRRKLKMGLVGLGFGGALLKGRILDGPGGEFFDVVKLCDMNREKARRFSEDTGIPACFDLDELLAGPDVEVVALLTNPNGRAGLLRRILRSGRNVITTKAFELDPEAALDVLREAERLGRVVHVNSPAPLANPALAQARAWVEQHALGAPVAGRVALWAARPEKADGSWLDDPERCPVAPMTRIGIYVINDLIRLFGSPASVHAMETRLFTERPTPDTAQLSVRFKNGALGHVLVSYTVAGGHGAPSWILNYRHGTILCNAPPQDEGVGWGGAATMRLIREDGDGQPTVETVAIAAGMAGYDWEAFHRACLGEKLEGVTTAEQIVDGVRVLNAAARSAKSGREEPC